MLLVASLCFICLAGAAKSVFGQAPTTDRVGFPENYQTTWKQVYTVDRPDSGQIRVIWANDKAASSLPGEPFPYGSMLLFESWRSKRDSAGNILLDAEGRFMKDELTTLFVRRKEPGFGTEYGANRNGEWEYVAYRPDRTYATTPQNTASCAICHKQVAAKDFVRTYNFGIASGAVPKAVMQQFSFVPRVLRVTPGTRVTWYNDDEEMHRIRAADGTWESTNLITGSSFDLVFQHRGVYNYVCTIHPAMRGAVLVELPVLRIDNASQPALGLSFAPGDSYRVTITHATPLAPIFLRIWRNGVDQGVSGPYGTTDATGTFSLSSVFTAADAATWQEQVLIGPPPGTLVASDERSNTISFTVAPANR